MPYSIYVNWHLSFFTHSKIIKIWDLCIKEHAEETIKNKYQRQNCYFFIHLECMSKEFHYSNIIDITIDSDSETHSQFIITCD